MMDELKNKELLSALVDGELQGEALEQALACAEDAEGCASWQLYHLVGDVLRSPDLAHHSHHDLLSGLRVQLAQEPVPIRAAMPAVQVASAQLEQVAPGLVAQQAGGAVALRDPAANAAVFRWKVAASFATVAAVAAISWHLMVPAGTTGPQLAQSAHPTGSVVAVNADGGQGVILRDPRLDALMANHQQYASRAALQAPADFLRNASFAAARTPNKASN